MQTGQGGSCSCGNPKGFVTLIYIDRHTMLQGCALYIPTMAAYSQAHFNLPLEKLLQTLLNMFLVSIWQGCKSYNCLLPKTNVAAWGGGCHLFISTIRFLCIRFFSLSKILIANLRISQNFPSLFPWRKKMPNCTKLLQFPCRMASFLCRIP